eukprot:TRINITY_DN8671_c0_g1_i2.p1 TRINITY_DN8671_c0_g1~~TRINITY_DN8671_c0_g1_i2.p1  ORF type:complete len:162 (-),score=17.42 TRINITY_DN8671_c0_g1_i2:444-929(-)
MCIRDRYIVNLPSPTYQYAKCIDWIADFDKRIRLERDCVTGAIHTVTGRDEASQQEMFKLFNQVQKQLALLMSIGDSKIKDIELYIIGRIHKETLLRQEVKDGVTLTITELVTDYYDSQPNGTENLAIPPDYFADPKCLPAKTAVTVLKFSVKNSKSAYDQ